jgi:nucleotide-binding universal stress UspA family protein
MQMQEIIVGVDDTATSKQAAERAAQMAVALDQPLHLVMAVKDGMSFGIHVGGDQFHVDWVTSASQFLKELCGDLPMPNATYALGGKDPAKSLVEEAGRLDASMIVVGNRRVKGMARLLGAVATDVIHHAPCDVLVVNTAN